MRVWLQDQRCFEESEKAFGVRELLELDSKAGLEMDSCDARSGLDGPEPKGLALSSRVRSFPKLWPLRIASHELSETLRLRSTPHSCHAMSIIASFFLWRLTWLFCLKPKELRLVPVLSEDSEQCNSVPRSPETTLWCQTSCQQLLAFVRMRMPYGTMDFQVLRRANEMNTWSVCPSAFRSIVFARLAEEIEGLGQGDLKVAQERLVAAEFAAREFVFTNISGYLEAGTSFAPWFHLNCVFGALERFSEALPERKELSKQSCGAETLGIE